MSAVEYREIPGFLGYMAGSDGTIWTRWKLVGRGYGRGNRAVLSDTMKPRSPCVDKTGYERVKLVKRQSEEERGKWCDVFVHKCVLLAFVGPAPKGMVCCHYDGNRTNNHIDNLRWDTMLSNCADTTRHGRGNEGERNGGAKLTFQQVIEIRERLNEPNRVVKHIMIEFGISRGQIDRIRRCLNWRSTEPPTPNELPKGVPAAKE